MVSGSNWPHRKRGREPQDVDVDYLTAVAQKAAAMNLMYNFTAVMGKIRGIEARTGSARFACEWIHSARGRARKWLEEQPKASLSEILQWGRARPRAEMAAQGARG